MFELPHLAGSPASGIVLETRLRRRIRNSQAPDPDARATAIFRRLLASHRGWELRKPESGIYNCFGHVWASRRTAVYDQPGVEDILLDDGYRRLSSNESPVQGDIGIYYDSAGTSVLHVGLVSDLRRISSSTGAEVGAPVAWLLSKWNDASGEVLHHFRDVPWADGDFTLAFWTDRPARGTP